MYRVLGADSKEYGPVDGTLLRRWISEGRANATTKVQMEGSTEWQALSDLPEFAEAVAAQQTAAPPPVAAPAGAKTSGLAVASLVCGVLGFCGITALAGLILGIMSLVRINQSGGRLSGKGVAIAGICVSGFMMLMAIPFMAALTLPALSRAKEKAQRIQCSNNLKQLALAVKIYSADNNETLPSPTKWCDAIQSHVGTPGTSAKIFVCPTEPDRRCGYAYNANLEGKKDNEINPQTVLLFESNAGWNGTGTANSVSAQRHSRQVVNVAFIDGSVRAVPVSQLGTLRWEP